MHFQRIQRASLKCESKESLVFMGQSDVIVTTDQFQNSCTFPDLYKPRFYLKIHLFRHCYGYKEADFRQKGCKK